MKTPFLPITSLFVALALSSSAADLNQAAHDAISTDVALAQNAIRTLRDAGPEGLAAFLAAHPSAHDGSNANRFQAAADAIAQQHDAHTSGLYWFTSMEEAKTEASRSGKPILSLRLLGKLSEEFSCANSRLFRTVLYPDREIATYLRTNYVLHWETVRPAPRATVDFGDGRTMDLPLTGNSIHYILDSSGEVVDALPGFYGPKTFLQNLRQDHETATTANRLTGNDKRTFLTKHHLEQKARLESEWQKLAKQAGVSPEIDAGSSEMKRVAAQLPIEQLSSGSRLGVEAQRTAPSDALVATRLAVSKSVMETPMLRMFRNLQNTMRSDTVLNEYRIRPVIHQWLAERQMDLHQLNDRVYAELFLTPPSDPWLGLLPRDVHLALESTAVK